MAFKDVLLTLMSYPEPTPVSVADDAVSVAAALGAHLAAISCEVHLEAPGNFLAKAIIDVPGIVAHESAKSRENAQGLLAALEAAAARSGVSHEAILEKCAAHKTPAMLVEYARLRDLTIMPEPEAFDLWYAEEIIFESGRPTLILPTVPLSRPIQFGSIGVAWDFSRTATRAVSDALPLLEKAEKVCIFIVRNEKSFNSQRSPDELAENLARHGIDAVLDEVDADGRPIGEVLRAYVLSRGIDLLVMGAYGQSRWREFVLGGATRSLLSKPPVPVFFSR